MQDLHYFHVRYMFTRWLCCLFEVVLLQSGNSDVGNLFDVALLLKGHDLDIWQSDDVSADSSNGDVAWSPSWIHVRGIITGCRFGCHRLGTDWRALGPYNGVIVCCGQIYIASLLSHHTVDVCLLLMLGDNDMHGGVTSHLQ